MIEITLMMHESAVIDIMMVLYYEYNRQHCLADFLRHPYHTRKDSYNHLNEEGLENCYKTTVRFLELIDQGVLDQPASR